MKTRFASRFLAATGLRPLLGRAMRWSGVLVLNYHRIGDGSRAVYDRGLWSATQDEFDAQVGWLKAHFDVVAPVDLPDILARRTGRCVLITFDDGYRDNYTAALPVLRRHRVPATFFVATGFLDEPRLPWWDEIAWAVRTSRTAAVELPGWLPSPVVFDEPDREGAVRTLLRAYKRTPAASTGDYLRAVREATGTAGCDPKVADDLWMTWDMIREMRTAGMTIGGHTVHHQILALMPRQGQREEIAGCARRLADELGEPMRYFSYPVGGPGAFNADTRACLREQGVHLAFSYYGGFRRFDDWDEFDVRRISVESDMALHFVQSRVELPQLFGRISH
jgi:peptidoglycan/xylan/chitin deacetylase (PgdA/CDA1 family)